MNDAAKVEELERLFQMRWAADMRAIKMWQAANPGNDLVWPDHADLCVWLMDRVAATIEGLPAIPNSSEAIPDG